MLRKDPNYRRLNVGGTGAFGSATYWLGPDHLLVVVMNGYVENYQRFMYSDIQAVLVRKTRVHYLVGFTAAAVAIGCLLGTFGLVQGRTIGNLGAEALTGFIVLLTLAALALSIVLVNWWKGPSCVCQLRTAVQTLSLPHLGRWRKGRQLLEELTPRVLAVQPRGSMELAAGESAAPAAERPAAPGPSGTGPVADPAGGRYVVDDPNAPPRILPS